MASSKLPPLCPLIPIHFAQSYTHFPTTLGQQKGNAKSREQLTSHHRCPSESLLLDGPPSWLDDLLNDTDTETQVPKSHRRSASDTFAYVESAAKPFDLKEGLFYKNVAIKSSNTAQIKPISLEEKFKKDFNLSESRSVEGHERVDYSSSQNFEGSVEGSTQAAKPSLPRKDGKRAKQQSAHRSRVRKLQYIGQLEKTVQLLQVGGSEIVAELEFVDQHNVILSMENRSLKQQLDSLTQEALIKQMEHEMLERELGRLQASYQFQMQKQMQMQQQQQILKNRLNKNREASLTRGSKNGSVQ